MASVLKLCLSSRITCVRTVLWPAALLTQPMFLLLISHSVPVTRASTQTTPALASMRFCPRNVWIKNRWSGSNTSRLHAENIPLQTTKRTWNSYQYCKMLFLCAQARRKPCIIRQDKDTASAYTIRIKKSKSLSGPYLNKLLPYSFKLNCHSVWCFLWHLYY